MKKIMIVLSVLCSVTVFAQSIPNKISFQTGQKLEVYTQINRSSTQELMGQTMESTVASSFTSLYNVVEASDNAATIESGTKRIKFDLSLFGRNENFDSDNPEDRKSEIGKMMSKAIGKTYTITVDPGGLVTAVKQPEEKGKKAGDEEAAGMMGMMMGRMNMGSGAPKVGEASLFKVLPKPVVKGDTWTDESKDEAGTKKGSFIVTDVTDKEVLIDFTEESTLQTKQQMMGMEAGINVKTNSKGNIILDKSTGLLKQKTFITTSEETITAGGQTMPSTSKMTTTITVKSL